MREAASLKGSQVSFRGREHFVRRLPIGVRDFCLPWAGVQ